MDGDPTEPARTMLNSEDPGLPCLTALSDNGEAKSCHRGSAAVFEAGGGSLSHGIKSPLTSHENENAQTAIDSSQNNG